MRYLFGIFVVVMLLTMIGALRVINENVEIIYEECKK